METLESTHLEPGGIPGDAHFAPRSVRQVLLIEAETLEALGLEPGQVRENITVEGIGLMELPRWTRLRVGQAELEVTMVCNPCSVMDEIRPGLQEELRGRRGILARVAVPGMVRHGDLVRVVERAAEVVPA
jgi:MOSC domain-containing protein YiiM